MLQLQFSGTGTLQRKCPRPPSGIAPASSLLANTTQMNFSRPSSLTASIVSASLLAGIITARAATVATPAPGDLLLAFRAAGGQGASVSYLVNIGSDLTFRNATPGITFTVSTGDIASDLASAYGSSWSSRTDLYWSVFGARQSVSSSLYATREQLPAGSASSPWPALNQTARNATATSVIDVISGLGGFTGSNASPNNPNATFQTNSASSSSYAQQVATAGTTDFGSLSQWTGIEGSFSSGLAGSALDLYRIGSTGTSTLGTFSLSAPGSLSFTPVPEPATAALTLAVGTFILHHRRRSLL